MFPVKEVQEAMLALRRAGYSSYLLTHRAESASPPIHTRLDSPTHHLVAGALAHRARGRVGPRLASPCGRPQSTLGRRRF